MAAAVLAGPAAFRAPQQLAGQRKPGQGAAPAVADQAKIREKISWADLMILAGNVALETMGFKTFGLPADVQDVWEPDDDVYWGRGNEWLGGDIRYSTGSPGVEGHGVIDKDDDSEVPHSRDLENPLARCKWA